MKRVWLLFFFLIIIIRVVSGDSNPLPTPNEICREKYSKTASCDPQLFIEYCENSGINELNLDTFKTACNNNKEDFSMDAKIFFGHRCDDVPVETINLFGRTTDLYCEGPVFGVFDCDGDGYSNPVWGDGKMGCPLGFDCDDDNSQISPGRTEKCTNKIDDDCDGLIDCCDPECNSDPSCKEDCTNKIDDNCDGLIDCKDSDCPTKTKCDSSNPNYECCSGSCSPIKKWYLDVDGDGYSPTLTTLDLCEGITPPAGYTDKLNGQETDCDDGDHMESPGIKAEACSDGKNNNCKDGTDCGDPYCTGKVCVITSYTSYGKCDTLSGRCIASITTTTTTTSVSPSTVILASTSTPSSTTYPSSKLVALIAKCFATKSLIDCEEMNLCDSTESCAGVKT